MEYRVIDGNKACSTVAYALSEICAIYPITPSSPMASNIDLLANKQHQNIFDDYTKIMEMQSEAGAAGTLHGLLQSGSLASTFTSSQGLLLMIPNLYKIAGEMLPGVIHVASRSIATHALSIFGDHQDIYAARMTGVCMLASTNVTDAYYLSLVAHLSAIKGSLPFMHFFDGFRTSHEVNKIKILSDQELLKFAKSQVDYKALDQLKRRLINNTNIISKGMAMNEDIYFQTTEARNMYYDQIPQIVAYYMKEINQAYNTNYQPFNYYGVKDATQVIIAMGSVCDTIKLVVDDLNKQGEKVGLVEVHLYRPFANKLLLKALPSSVATIAVLDRTKEAGSSGEPLYLDVVNATKDLNINVVGGRYGLSSKNIPPADVKSVFTMLKKKPVNNFVIGIEDDLTNLSLKKENYHLDIKTNDLLIYGFGSDGMVSASKDILTIVGDKTPNFVQGYFSYDSKKSGGITISNLRIKDKPFNAPYYVDNAHLVVVTKENYFLNLAIIDKLRKGGTLLINTDKDFTALNKYLPNNVKKALVEKDIIVYTINASLVANECHIKGKINKIMEAIILKLLNFKNYEELVIESIKEVLGNKGEDIVNNNILAVQKSIEMVNLINDKFTFDTQKDLLKQDVITAIVNREGDNLSTSQVACYKNGVFNGGNTDHEKRQVINEVPKWDKSKCIECTLCSLACPHAVVRPIILTKKDSNYEMGKPVLEQKDKFNFLIGLSEDDCTGCGICTRVCPTNALEFGPKDAKYQKIINDLFTNHENPQIFEETSLKGSQIKRPLFAYSGACAGCGETPYLKLLTQLFGEKLVIANATGCSSIYAGSAPSTPYKVAWSNSLFEDNAEYALGLHLSYQNKQARLKLLMETAIANKDPLTKLYKKYLANATDYSITKEVYDELLKVNPSKKIKDLLDYVPAKTVFAIGGDGWAYDIGFGGIDHLIASNENVKILVLDTEVYSNTGGQMSKSSHLGQVAEFANYGKKTSKKDLAKIALTYPHCYVGTISLGANPRQAIKVLTEAEEYNGPAIIIAYATCVEHGIKGGLINTFEVEKLAVQCGYFLLMHYHPADKKLVLDSPQPNFDKYDDFLNNELRYNALIKKDPQLAEELLTLNKNNAIKRYEYYSNLIKK